MSATFGMLNIVASFILACQLFCMPASPSVDITCFALVSPASCAFKSSSVDVGGPGRLAVPKLKESSTAQPEMKPGMLATCSASSPSDMDFACGFHENWS